MVRCQQLKSLDLILDLNRRMHLHHKHPRGGIPIEIPLVIYIGLLLHNIHRCKDMINDLNNVGLCISYKTVLEISTSVGNAEIAKYNAQNLVCPSRLKQGLVTTIAVDNIDQSTSSMTATSSLHGTAISITQHPLTSNNEVGEEPQTI